MNVFPTKGNLINTKKSLGLARLGFELLDRKRNILVREMMMLIDTANAVQNEIDETYHEAYLALQTANITLGMCGEIGQEIPVDTSVNITFRSIMGVEIPMVTIDNPEIRPTYGLNTSNSLLDEAYLKFNKVKKLTAQLSEIENSVYRLADAVKKTQKRANALRNIMIPRFEETVKYITAALEEKDREEFSRLKVIKAQKLKNDEV